MILDSVAVAELAGRSVVFALAVAFLLGLRHATDPDHLAAVATLVLGEGGRRARRAGALGLAWGAGHATTLVALGLPAVLVGHRLPDAVQRGAEFAVGVVIIVLAARLLRRWRDGHFKLHPGARDQRPLDTRSPRSAFGIGLVHGVGGSAGAGILVVTAAGEPAHAAVALLVFAAATALSMALVSGAVGHAVSRRPVVRRIVRIVPAFGLATLLFGIWYALGALALVPYTF